MGMITIRCPVTGRQVPTGMVMDRGEFEHAVLGSNEMRCPACGRMHHWTKDDAELRENPPAGR